MRCPVCDQDGSDVVDSRPAKDGRELRRRRKCPAGHRFTTFEVIRDEDKDAEGRAAAREHVAGLLLALVKAVRRLPEMRPPPSPGPPSPP